ncbi:hypothetical protein INT45_014262 [Circinella minor]|uniref:Uncharacterized protein n=1 Tax=Circinella minor TaxID=1195481 RepID=A0A8H7SDJ2_9FUNG|nr:hypothetical protein INT45_014262 [Circinella minor]
MASQHLSQSILLQEIDDIPYPDENSKYYWIIRRVNRTKWENIAFASIQLWFVSMVVDASVYQNMPEVIALAVINMICAILGGVQIIQSKKTEDMILDASVYHLRMVFYLAIAVTTLLGIFSCIFFYISYMVVREVGWVTYKKIGPDMRIQRLYTVFQMFVLILKIDIFVEFLVSCFYVTQFATDNGGFQWETWIELIITVLILPMLYFAREAVALEKRWWMASFITFQVIAMLGFILMIYQTTEPNNLWYTYIVVISMIFALQTIVLASWTMFNFGKGLKPYIQRGSDKRNYPTQQHQLEPDEKSALNKNNADAWQIDDD